MSTNRLPALCIDWSQITHIPASTKRAKVYKAKESPHYSIFVRELHHIPGLLLAFQASLKTVKPTPASNNSQASHSMSYKAFSVGGFLPNFIWPHDIATRHIKGTPSLLIAVAATENHKQAKKV